MLLVLLAERGSSIHHMRLANWFLVTTVLLLRRRCMLKLHGWCSRRRQSHPRRHVRLLLLVLWHHCWLDRGLLVYVTYLLLLHMWELLVL